MTKAERAELRLAIERLGITVDEGIKLKKCSVSLQKIGVRVSDGFFSAQSEKWNKTHEETIYRTINTLLAKYGNKFYFFHQTDPRGAQVYIIDLENEDFTNKYSEWVAENSLGLKPYYGDNLYNFLRVYYSQFGIAF